MSAYVRQFHRPARLDPEAAESLHGAQDTAVTSELAHRSAAALLGSQDGTEGVDGAEGTEGTEEADEPLTAHAVAAAVAAHGVEAVAELWADSPATTLPGTLWRLYLVREWIRRDPQLVARRYATTVDLTEADAGTLARFERIVADGTAGARPVPSPEEVRARVDEVLAGRHTGGAAGLEGLLAMVAEFLHALAVGSSPVWIDDDADPLADPVTVRDSALEATSVELAQAARRARAGALD